jgi:hypothetical protein
MNAGGIGAVVSIASQVTMLLRKILCGEISETAHFLKEALAN